MKKLLLLLFSIAAFAQPTITPGNQPGQVSEFPGGVIAKKTMTIPVTDGDPFPALAKFGQIRVSPSDSIFRYSNGVNWVPVYETYPTKLGEKFVAVPNVDGDGDTVGCTGLTYNTKTGEYVISYYSYTKDAQLWFFGRNSKKLKAYNPLGTITPVPDRTISVITWLKHVQGVAYDNTDNTYWVLGSRSDVPTPGNTHRRIIHINDSGSLIGQWNLSAMTFQAGQIAIDNAHNQLFVKDNISTTMWVLDKASPTTILNTVTTASTTEGMTYDPATGLLWLASDEGAIYVYSYNGSAFTQLSWTDSFKTLDYNGDQNVEGLLIDPVDGKLLMCFDAYLHGSHNNGNCLWKFDISNRLFDAKNNLEYIGTTSNFNTTLSSGVYFGLSSATGNPTGYGGYLKVCAFYAGGSGALIEQEFISFNDNRKLFRWSVNGGSSWNTEGWQTVQQQFRGTVTNLNTTIKNGQYYASATATGRPVDERGHLYVSTDTNTSITAITQIFISLEKGYCYTRATIDGGATWTNWRTNAPESVTDIEAWANSKDTGMYAFYYSAGATGAPSATSGCGLLIKRNSAGGSSAGSEIHAFDTNDNDNHYIKRGKTGSTWRSWVKIALDTDIAALTPYSATAVLDFLSVAAQSSSDLTVTVTGAVAGKPVTLGVPNGSVMPNSSFTAWVLAANTVTVRFNNYSAAAQDPPSGTFTIQVAK